MRDTSGHHCHAWECSAPVPPEMLFCKPHWALTPKTLQRAVWDSYRPGQCDDMRPSEAWFKAADAAIAYVAVAEGKWTQERADHWLKRHERVTEPAEPRIWVTSVKQGCYLRYFTQGGPPGVPDPATPFVYVGRRLGQYPGSVLGNPFRPPLYGDEEEGGDSAVARYRGWLQEKLVPGGAEMEELLRIMRLGAGSQGVVLGCWCADRGAEVECHANEVREAALALWRVGWR